MLSKSAARKFFIVGTALCSTAFILLTVDTISQVPKRTHEENLTPQVARGKHLFDRNNCMGCHTIMGEGAYYAPELTKVYERRGPQFIKALIKDPQAMFPGERKMVKYDLKDEEIDDLVAFFKWIGEMDLNGFPAKPNLAQPPAALAKTVSAVPQPKIFSQMCVACHTMGGAGGAVGPALDDVGSRRDKAFLVRWLKNPMEVKADSRMPKLPLSDNDIEELSSYLASKKGTQQ